MFDFFLVFMKPLLYLFSSVGGDISIQQYLCIMKGNTVWTIACIWTWIIASYSLVATQNALQSWNLLFLSQVVCFCYYPTTITTQCATVITILMQIFICPDRGPSGLRNRLKKVFFFFGFLWFIVSRLFFFFLLHLLFSYCRHFLGTICNIHSGKYRSHDVFAELFFYKIL